MTKSSYKNGIPFKTALKISEVGIATAPTCNENKITKNKIIPSMIVQK